MFIKIYLITLPIFFIFDFAWLALVAKNFYAKEIGFLLKTNTNFIAAISFYLLFVVGLVIFVLSPALQKHSLMQAILTGALFGLISYATYDLTNLATIKNWPLIVTFVDIVWGATLSGLVCLISYLIASKLGL